MSRKEKVTREQLQERARAEQEAHKRQAQEYKDRLRPLVRFLRAHHLRFSHAQVANERVEYFRLDEFEKLLESQREQVEADAGLAELVRRVNSELIFFRRPDSTKAKYPKALEPVLPTHADRKFACFRFDTTESRHWLTMLAIVGVLAVVLFPIWPYEVKYGIWLVSLVLLVALVGVILLRLALYLLVVIFDYHVWLFPNFLNSSGFWDSFVPVLEVTRGDKSWFNVFIRLFAVSGFLLLVLHVYLNPSFIDEQIAFTKDTIQDVHDWGVGKLKNEGNFSQRALTNLAEILNETADAHDDPEDPQEPQEAQESNEESTEGEEQGHWIEETEGESGVEAGPEL